MDEQEFKDGDLMPWQDMTAKIKELEVCVDLHTRSLDFDNTVIKNYQVFLDEHTERLQQLEARVDSLTRSLDILQDVTGIEVVVTMHGGNSGFETSELKQQEFTQEGQCPLCDRVALLSSNNICEACSWEELYNESNIVL